MPTSLTKLKDLEETKLIEELTHKFKLSHKSSIYGIGDDAAVLDNGDSYTLISTDMLVEGVHFDLTYCPLKHVGYKAVTTSIADIVAMNGVAQQITVSIAVSNKFTLETLQELYLGVHKACTNYQIDLIGGDTSSSIAGLLISVTAIGKVDKNKLCLRKGAKPYDLVCVTGNLGAAYLGLQILGREKKVFEADPNMQPQLEAYAYLVERQLKPEAPTNIVTSLAKLDICPTSMIDISDALISQILRIGRASDVGITIYEDKLPIHPETNKTADSFHLSSTLCALHGGEDYELLFTVDQNDYAKLEKELDIHVIGYVTEIGQGFKMIRNNNEIIDLIKEF